MLYLGQIIKRVVIFEKWVILKAVINKLKQKNGKKQKKWGLFS